MTAGELSCVEVVELVSDYLEGALDAAVAERVAAHLSLCDGCTQYVEQLRATTGALGALCDDTLAPAVQDRLRAAFRDFRRERGA